jgi:phosphohistidine phosphatase
VELFIIRHAPAVKHAPRGDDTHRPLTLKGADRWRKSVGGLRALGVRFDRLFHSPWRRAVETANLAAPLVDGKSVVTERLATEPGKALLDELQGERVALVGHEPWLSQLLAWLVVGEQQASERFVLKKGSVAWLSGEPKPGQMRLNALFTPKALRSLKR